MLDFLRKRKRSWIITILLGLIIIVFIAFYGGSKYQDPGVQDIAQVNDEVISQQEFALHYQRALERYRELFKGSLTPEMLKGLNLKGALLEELIRKSLALQEARRLGLAAGDEELVQHIAQTPEFQVNGRFNKERYLQLLRLNRMSPAQFEQEQREQLTLRRLYSVILDSVRVNETEVRDRYRLEQEKINLQFVRLPLGQFAAEAKVTEEDVQKFYERNKDTLKEPLKVRVEYLSYPFEPVASSIQVDEKEIQDYYQANREAKYHKPKQAKLRYIHVRLAPGADAKQQQEARARADRILKEARTGKDFAQLAKKDSDDPSSAQGGDIGWMAQGQLPPPLDKVVFSLAKGQITDVIENAGGFQIVKVEDLKEAHTESLKEATPDITRALKIEKAKAEAAKTADRGREKALTGAEFGKLAEESGAPVNVTGWFSSGELLPEIGQNQEFYKSAFALSPKEVSPVIAGNKAYYLLRIKERKEATVPPLDAIRSDVERRVRESKARELLSQKANALLDQLKKEKDLARVAGQHGVKLEETGWFLRNAPELPKIGQIPELKAGGLTLSAQKPFPERIVIQKDAALIFAFKDRQEADMKKFENEKDALVKQTLAESRQQVLEKFMDHLKAKAAIQVHASALEES
ncbi:MAG TPA: SurA N-terminal domain-containing protein [Candidatus Binatia bacterium]|nr:SurA N-terminal domain-containing protein [Candidatus Binatia bacterium]